MKKISLILLILVVVLVAGLFYFSKNKAKNSNKNNLNEDKKVSEFQFPGILEDAKIKNKKAVIKTSKGTIEFELYADKAPKTVSNFVYLTEKGYYDGLTFHRVVPDFVIQGGDPTGTGAGGPGYKFDDETVQGDYLEGTVAMANAGPDTNGSQFFICLENLPTLPKSYNLFGQVITGMDVVKKIAVGDKMESVKIVNR